MGTVTAPICKTELSIIHHSVLFCVEIKATLSPFFIPTSINFLDII